MDANSPTHFMTSGYRFCSIMVFFEFPLLKICQKGEIINDDFKNDIIFGSFNCQKSERNSSDKEIA
jgi:hypothetical protein